MDIGFVHIGMTKTASTYMQNAWSASPEYAIQWGNNRKFLYQMREQVAQNKKTSSVHFKIQPEQPFKDKKIVVSSEGFSTAYLNDLENQNKIPDFITHISQQLSPLSKHTSNLLIVIRDPISWIKSIYIQSIKEGGDFSAQHFVDNQKAFIKNSLNIRHIVKSYSYFFKNILILPYEVMIQDERLFWGVISDVFECPLPSNYSQKKQNKSPSLYRVHLMASLNKMQKNLARTLISHQMDIPGTQQISDQYLESGKWLNRRIAEFSTDDEIETIRLESGIPTPPQDWMDFILDSEIKEYIKENFIQFLFENILPEYPEQYQINIDNN